MKNADSVFIIYFVRPNQVKTTFHSIMKVNLCIESSLHNSNGYKTSILNCLLFCFGVIKFNNIDSENIFGMVLKCITV